MPISTITNNSNNNSILPLVGVVAVETFAQQHLYWPAVTIRICLTLPVDRRDDNRDQVPTKPCQMCRHQQHFLPLQLIMLCNNNEPRTIIPRALVDLELISTAAWDLQKLPKVNLAILRITRIFLIFSILLPPAMQLQRHRIAEGFLPTDKPDGRLLPKSTLNPLNNNNNNNL